MSNPIPANVLDPSQSMKTHVSEMSPAQRLAEHDRRARERNSGLDPVAAPATSRTDLSPANLVALSLDVVKDFERKGFSVSTLTPELVTEGVEKRFPSGFSLVVGSAVKTPVEKPVKLDTVDDIAFADDDPDDKPKPKPEPKASKTVKPAGPTPKRPAGPKVSK